MRSLHHCYNINNFILQHWPIAKPIHKRDLPWERLCWDERIARLGAKRLILVFRNSFSIQESLSVGFNTVLTDNPSEPFFVNGIANSSIQQVAVFESIEEYSIAEDFRIFCYSGRRSDLQMQPSGSWRWSAATLPRPPPDSADELLNRRRVRAYFLISD